MLLGFASRFRGGQGPSVLDRANGQKSLSVQGGKTFKGHGENVRVFFLLGFGRI